MNQIQRLPPEPPSPQAAPELTLWGCTDPGAVIEKAAATAQHLARVVRDRGLVTMINGREYPHAEAWTLLGSMLGVFPVCTWTKSVEGGWEARVEGGTRSGDVIGAAEAQCTTHEARWRDRDAFQLRSMAQTRATAKALRLPLGFVMQLAGLDPTPAEEMSGPPDAGRASKEAPNAVQPLRSPNFGPSPSLPIHELADQDLEFYGRYLREHLDDPDKASYRDRNLRLLDAMRREAVRRRDEARQPQATGVR